MICETNKEFKDVDKQIHKLKVMKLGKLPSLES